jgi:hypothetical protein
VFLVILRNKVVAGIEGIEGIKDVVPAGRRDEIIRAAGMDIIPGLGCLLVTMDVPDDIGREIVVVDHIVLHAVLFKEFCPECGFVQDLQGQDENDRGFGEGSGEKPEPGRYLSLHNFPVDERQVGPGKEVPEIDRMVPAGVNCLLEFRRDEFFDTDEYFFTGDDPVVHQEIK